MKLKKLMLMGILLIGMIIVLESFSGVFGHYSDKRNERIGFVAEDGTLLDLDGNPISEENENELKAQAILEEQQVMANPPRFNVSANEIQEMIDSLDLSDDFEFSLDAQGTESVGTITITIDSMNPLADSALMNEFEKITTLILKNLGVYYPKKSIEHMMKTVFETKAIVDFIEHTDDIYLEFASFGDKSTFDILKSQ